MDCASEKIYVGNTTETTIEYEKSSCISPWVSFNFLFLTIGNFKKLINFFQQMTETCSLAVLMSFFFLRIHFQLKLIIGIAIFGIYTWCISKLQLTVFESGETWNPDLEPKVAHILNVAFLVIGLHLMDRQVSMKF